MTVTFTNNFVSLCINY
ncbi:TPA: hypothetical protein ACHR26_001996 [Streptococcus equi subsp. zooepidemicus]